MSRKKRIREEALPHHVICRSIPELLLFQSNADKEKYLSLMKEASIEYQCDIIAYCLMDTHVHILLHPKGADISKVMRKINNLYAKYYNKAHSRRGHLFDERFKNYPIDDESYFLRVSAYIHNNAKDLPGFADKIEAYQYSSLGIYLGIHLDRYNMVSVTSIFKHLATDLAKSRIAYANLMNVHRLGKDCFEQKVLQDITKFRSEKRLIKRDLDPENVLSAASKVLGIKDTKDHRYQSIVSILLTALCSKTRRETAQILGIISLSKITSLARNGIRLLESSHQGLFTKIIQAL